MGDEGDETYRTFNWNDPEIDPKDPEKVLDKFSEHFEPVTTHRLYRYQLMNMRQGAMPVDLYVKELKTLALKCKFRDSKDVEDHMLDQLIWGCSSPEVQKNLIGKNEKLTLPEAVGIIRNHEATRQHMESLNSMTPSSVNAVTQGGRGRGRKFPRQRGGNQRDHDTSHYSDRSYGEQSIRREYSQDRYQNNYQNNGPSDHYTQEHRKYDGRGRSR